MANQNNTREGIHSGLSQSKSDQKWSDMLNFRCSDNRTFAVPRRLGMLQADAGLHTVLHGVGDVNYAIGSRKSYLFRGHDSTSFDRLWKARLVRETVTEDQSENLKLRGSYTGNVPRNIRLTVVNGKLVLDSDWPVTPEPEVEVPYVPELNCDGAVGVGATLSLEVTVLPDVPLWSLLFNQFSVGDVYKFGLSAWVEDVDRLYYCGIAYTATDPAEPDTSAYYPTSGGENWTIVYMFNVEGTTWDPGHVVYRDGVIYLCKLATSGFGSLPDQHPGTGAFWTTYWTVLGEVPAVPASWDGQGDYANDDFVRNGDIIYQALSTHTPDATNEPGVGASWETYWEDVTLAETLPATAAELTIYQGTALIGNFTANANGLFSITLTPNPYTITAGLPDHEDVITEVTMAGVDQTVDILIL